MFSTCLHGRSRSTPASSHSLKTCSADCKLAVGVHVGINGCLSILALRQTGHLSRVYPTFCDVTAGMLFTIEHRKHIKCLK